MTYQEAVQYLESFLNYEQVTAYRYPEAFSLGRMEKLLERLGNPHQRYPTFHVAGTKGKGSTCAFSASILQASGVRVGLYTSPHLASFRERIRIGGVPISREALAQVVARVEPFAGEDLTYFEVTTACAFLYFAREEVEAAVIEVGLGGRLDATNVVSPYVSAITPVSLDHMEKLGDTLSKIAREKAGIMKRAVPVVIAPQPPQAEAALQEAALAARAPVHLFKEEVRVRSVQMTPAGSRCTFQTPVRLYEDILIPLLGRHQITNALTAVRMLELAGQIRGDLPPRAVREGLARTQWPGRCQLLEGSPPILLDGAHNAASAGALRETVEELFPGKRVILIVGTSLEKDLEGMAQVLGPWCSELLVTRAQVPRAESPQKLAQAFHRWRPSPLVTVSVQEALDRARQRAALHDLVVVTGSLFVVGEALEFLSAGGACAQEKVSHRSLPLTAG